LLAPVPVPFGIYVKGIYPEGGQTFGNGVFYPVNCGKDAYQGSNAYGHDKRGKDGPQEVGLNRPQTFPKIFEQIHSKIT